MYIFLLLNVFCTCVEIMLTLGNCVCLCCENKKTFRLSIRKQFVEPVPHFTSSGYKMDPMVSKQIKPLVLIQSINVFCPVDDTERFHGPHH